MNIHEIARRNYDIVSATYGRNGVYVEYHLPDYDIRKTVHCENLSWTTHESPEDLVILHLADKDRELWPC